MPSKINKNLILWGVRMGFMSYGWDAGVLGGVLQTKAFQSAMKVCETLYNLPLSFMSWHLETFVIPPVGPMVPFRIQRIPRLWVA